MRLGILITIALLLASSIAAPAAAAETNEDRDYNCNYETGHSIDTGEWPTAIHDWEPSSLTYPAAATYDGLTTNTEHTAEVKTKVYQSAYGKWSVTGEIQSSDGGFGLIAIESGYLGPDVTIGVLSGRDIVALQASDGQRIEINRPIDDGNYQLTLEREYISDNTTRLTFTVTKFEHYYPGFKQAEWTEKRTIVTEDKLGFSPNRMTLTSTYAGILREGSTIKSIEHPTLESCEDAQTYGA